MMRRFGLSFMLDVLSVCAAVGAASFWWAAAAVSFPSETDLTMNGRGWEAIADALLDQSAWNRYGAAYAGVAIGLQAMSVIARRVRR